MRSSVFLAYPVRYGLRVFTLYLIVSGHHDCVSAISVCNDASARVRTIDNPSVKGKNWVDPPSDRGVNKSIYCFLQCACLSPARLELQGPMFKSS